MSYLGRSSEFGVRSRFIYTAAGSETSITGNDDNNNALSFTDGAYVDVYLNGVLLVPGTDYNTTTANTIGGLAALAASDVVEVVVYDTFNVADTVPASTGGTFNGNITANAFYGDGSNLTGLAASFSDLTDATVSTTDPTITSNPGATGHLWLNKTSGEIYVCTDATAGANTWTNVGDGTGSVGTYSVDFLMIAGGGAGGAHGGSGGGAGGYRNSYNNEASGGQSTSENPLSLLRGTQYTVIVGGGASGVVDSGASNGTDSEIFGTGLSITSIGGAGGRSGVRNPGVGNDGGSGGGGAHSSTTFAGGSGTSGQGSDGGASVNNFATGGGGGAGAAGSSGSGSNAGNGGGGLSSSITGTSVARAGGGGGSAQTGSHGTGGSGGGGNGGNSSATSGTVNTGSGGGGIHNSTSTSGSGGGGVVILRMATIDYTGTTTGSPTVTTDGSDTILTFTQSGSYTA